jgi:hypothetical protein
MVLAQQAASFISRAASNARWLPTGQLAAFTGNGREGPVSLPRHRAGSFFPRELHDVLATRLGWGGRPQPRRVARTRPTHAPTTSRPRVVANSPHTKQLPLHLQAHRDCLPPRRLKRLRMGRRLERQPQLLGTRLLGRTRPPPTHYLERATRSPTRNRVLPPSARGPQCPPTQEQHHCGRILHQAYYTITYNDGRDSMSLVPSQHQRHPHSTPLHPVRSKYLGGFSPPRNGHRGMQVNPRIFSKLQ